MAAHPSRNGPGRARAAWAAGVAARGGRRGGPGPRHLSSSGRAVEERVQRVADLLAAQPGTQRAAQRTIARDVGREEACHAPAAHLLQDSALAERAVQAHQLRHPLLGPHPVQHAGPVEVHQQHLRLAVSLAQQEVLQVEVGMAASGVVEAPDGRAGCRRRAEQACAAGVGLQEGEGVLGERRVARPDRRVPERARHPPRGHEQRCRHRRARGPQPLGHLQLGQRPARAEEGGAEQGTEQPAMAQRPEQHLDSDTRKRQPGGGAATAHRRELAELALGGRRREQASGARGGRQLLAHHEQEAAFREAPPGRRRARH